MQATYVPGMQCGQAARVQFMRFSQYRSRSKTLMLTVRQELSPADVSALKSFLSNPHRPGGTLRFHELQGFLFTIASSPETIQPSEWLPIISNDEDIGFENEIEAERVLILIMALYNQVNSSVLDHSDAMPSGCEFQADIDANFDEESSVSQWSRGFVFGHDWLAEVWDECLPESMDEEFGATVMALSFFSSTQLAEAFCAEMDLTDRTSPGQSFEQLAETIRELFPAALSSYSSLGRIIFEVLMQNAATDDKPARSAEIGRNDPCPCGSGKKYKKCCAASLH